MACSLARTHPLLHPRGWNPPRRRQSSGPSRRRPSGLSLRRLSGLSLRRLRSLLGAPGSPRFCAGADWAFFALIATVAALLGEIARGRSQACSGGDRLCCTGSVKRAERELILRQGVVKPETPRERRQREALIQDLEGSPLRGRPLPLRLRNFRPNADTYLASLGGPLPYMLRLRRIAEQTEGHEEALGEAWRAVAAECEGDAAAFARRWRETAERWSFHEVNDFIERHNRWYPAESRLPMDPQTRDFALVNGQDYRCRSLDAAWVLERFPASLSSAKAAARSRGPD